jgi:hypothetical protein
MIRGRLGIFAWQLNEKKWGGVLRRKLIASFILIMVLFVSSVEAASWVYVMRDPNVGANWYIDKDSVEYDRGFLCFSAQVIYDNANTNGYKTMAADYEVKAGSPSIARAVALVFIDGVGNIIDSAEDPDSDQWYDIPSGSIGYELMKYAERYVK